MNLWRVLGVRAMSGRAFVAGEERQGSRVVMIGHGLAERWFGSPAEAVGQPIDLDGERHTIVGVVPDDVGFATEVAVWKPLGPFPDPRDPFVESRGDRRLAVVGRLAAGATLDAAGSELNAIAGGSPASRRTMRRRCTCPRAG